MDFGMQMMQKELKAEFWAKNGIGKDSGCTISYCGFWRCKKKKMKPEFWTKNFSNQLSGYENKLDLQMCL